MSRRTSMRAHELSHAQNALLIFIFLNLSPGKPREKAGTTPSLAEHRRALIFVRILELARLLGHVLVVLPPTKQVHLILLSTNGRLLGAIVLRGVVFLLVLGASPVVKGVCLRLSLRSGQVSCVLVNRLWLFPRRLGAAHGWRLGARLLGDRRLGAGLLLGPSLLSLLRPQDVLGLGGPRLLLCGGIGEDPLWLRLEPKLLLLLLLRLRSGRVGQRARLLLLLYLRPSRIGEGARLLLRLEPRLLQSWWLLVVRQDV
mmetsp:Transcript_22801/g.50006  ORF Transcript_22801/g.50006 Transcript_22801/m.50006 type:complete len:257 (+) Transcript_22801:49-819(+)